MKNFSKLYTKYSILYTGFTLIRTRLRRNLVNVHGFTLIELLVTVTIFAALGIIVTQSIILTLRGTRKSENLISVRENLNNSLGVIERQLRNAESIVTCPNPDTRVLNYRDENGVATAFTCASMTGTGYIASGSARLTGEDIKLTECSFTCSEATVSGVPSVEIALTAKNANVVSTAETGQVTISTKIFLRTY
jgi:prepilin-type N-terminal cleavage/methylation domain-containing protein